jgi:hypothetical protein
VSGSAFEVNSYEKVKERELNKISKSKIRVLKDQPLTVSEFFSQVRFSERFI